MKNKQKFPNISRVDLPDQPVIDAVAENVVGSNRGTVVKQGDVQVSTIEHAMAALYASSIDNCLIKVNAPESPSSMAARAYIART